MPNQLEYELAVSTSAAAITGGASGAITIGAERYMREPEVFTVTGLSRTTRWRMERKGEFPQRRKLSENAIGWRASEIAAWLENRQPANMAA